MEGDFVSLFFRAGRPAEERAITSLPWSHGGESPLQESLDAHLGLVPVYAAVRLIADSIAALPMQAYRKAGDDRVSIPLPMMFADPVNATRMTWVQQAMTSLLLRGNAYGLKVGRDPAAMTSAAIKWLNPDCVTFDEADGWRYNGNPVAEADMLHIPGLVMPGKRLGVSPISACSAAVTAGLSTQTFMRDWYRNKAIPSVHFHNDTQTLESTDATAIKDRLTQTLRNGEPFVTGKDWTLDILTLTADDAGFVASSRLTATQVATIFGIPPGMIGGETGGSLTYSTVELNQIQFLTNTLLPWLTRLEAAFSGLMPKPQYVKFNVDALIRVDTKTRHEVYQIDRTIGLRSIDEIRKLEDESPLPDGAGADHTPLSQMGAARGKETR